MNRPTKRLLALTGSALLGAFGAIAFASPAQAHHVEVAGKADCQADGQYKIEWTVTNPAWPNPKAKILEVKTTPATAVTNIIAGKELDKDEAVTGVQLVPGATKVATIWVKAQWFTTGGQPTDIIKEATGKVEMPGTCVAPPSVTGASTCDKFTVKLTNPQGAQPTEATVTYGTQTQKVTVAPGTTVPVELIPSSETEATIKFTGSDEVFKVTYEKPANCGGLPQTGASTGTYVASGTGLATLGVLVFFLARRRQVRLRRIASM